MADRHTLIGAFEKSGMQRDAAEEIATEIFDIIHDNVATKGDLALAVRDLKSDLAVAVSDVKIWTGSLFALVVAILSGVMTLFHFLGGAAGHSP